MYYLESEIIYKNILSYAINNEVLININIDKETFKKSYDFLLSFDEVQGFESVESTLKNGVLNEVLKELLNNGFNVSFDANYY
ncbi:MAG: hypothetical protein IKG40_03600 [Bacilli bacterium]|nr:hypothetical protein [Bacilli bacterium]